ncbi:hypothetical protein DFH11DRAFT_1189358 [Phellopilus nigrolimitatus]|nr:hypothetical protein DFH11DRAFT_1189358 [Phellopilus nigrolimitatus]
MANTEPRTPPLPFEITENIIQLYLGGPYTFPRSHRPSDLAPLLLVCKGWHEYGERQLYESISITTDSKDSQAIGVSRLLATLSQNSRLANLVRFFAVESKCFGVEHVRAITQIISLSLNLTHLSISRLGEDWQKLDTTLIESLRHALAERSLKHLRLHSTYIRRGRGKYNDMLCSPKETLALLAYWPDLKEFSLIDDQNLHRNRFKFPAETSVRCLALRRVKVQGLNKARFLAKIAPFVEDVDIEHYRFADMETLACLHTWSESLVRLKLHITKQPCDMIPYFPPLRKLRYFYCEVTHVHPKFLESMDSLEELFYYVNTRHVELLVNCFRLGAGSGDFLPALKVLHFRLCVQAKFDYDLKINWRESVRAESKALVSLEEICARRSISFNVDDYREYYE